MASTPTLQPKHSAPGSCPTCGRPDFLTWTYVADLVDDMMAQAREDLEDEAAANGQVLVTNRVMAIYQALDPEREPREVPP